MTNRRAGGLGVAGLCLLGAIMHNVFLAGEGKDHYYLDTPGSSPTEFIQKFFTYFLLNASFVSSDRDI